MRLLELVGLAHRMDHLPQQMSGGQQQRIAIARALVNQPSLLLADEPTGNLDSTTTEEILQMFAKLNDDEGITIVIVTHEADVAKHCKRMVRNARRTHRGSEPRNSGQWSEDKVTRTNFVTLSPCHLVIF